MRILQQNAVQKTITVEDINNDNDHKNITKYQTLLVTMHAYEVVA